LLTIIPLGTCRLASPLRKLAGFGVVKVDLTRIYGFVHTTDEILQQIGFLLGTRDIPTHMRPLIGQYFNHSRCAGRHMRPDLYFVEVSINDTLESEGFQLQPSLLQVFTKGIFEEPKTRSDYMLAVARDDRAEIERILSGLAGVPEDKLRLLRNLRQHRQTADEIQDGIARIRSALDADMVLMTHVDAKAPDGATIPERERLIADVVSAANRLAIRCFNPTADLNEVGQAQAMANNGIDTTHWADGFESRIATRLLELAGIGPDSSPEAARWAAHASAAAGDLTPQQMFEGNPRLIAHAERVFLPLSGMNASLLATLKAEKKRVPNLDTMLAAGERLLGDDIYGELQRDYLTVEALTKASSHGSLPEQRFLDFPYFVHRSLNIARGLDLAGTKPRSILEIGAGAGHLGFVARQMGHSYLGTDYGLGSMLDGEDRNLFTDLNALFQNPTQPLAIKAKEPLALDGQFSDIVSISKPFCRTITPDGGKHPWQWRDWVFFLTNLIESHTTPDFRLHFQISRTYVPADVWAHIERLSEACDLARVSFRFGPSLTVDKLSSSLKAA
jgi:hypothetical protein